MALETNVIATGTPLDRMPVTPRVRRKGRQPRSRETGDLVAAIRRLLRAVASRAADEDVEHLAELVELRRDVEARIVQVVGGLRAQGVTWAEIGRATGTTGQAATMKWLSKIDADNGGAGVTKWTYSP